MTDDSDNPEPLGEKSLDLSALFEEYAPALLYFFQKRGHDIATAEDLLIDTFVDLLRLVDGPDTYFDKAKPLIFTIAGRKSALHFRRKQRAEKVFNEIAYTTDGFDAPEIERIMAMTEEVHTAINTLPPHLKQVIILKYFTQLTYLQMSEVLSIPVGTVKTRCHEARMTLKGMLSDDRRAPLSAPHFASRQENLMIEHDSRHQRRDDNE